MGNTAFGSANNSLRTPNLQLQPQHQNQIQNPPSFDGLDRSHPMKPHPASGRASALRGNHTSAANPKTRLRPYSIAVRAVIEKSMHSKENQPRFSTICLSPPADRCRILPHEAVTFRFPDYCRLKTADSQPRCGLLFPKATRHRNTTGLLEQMP